jgi:hypothetical protein
MNTRPNLPYPYHESYCTIWCHRYLRKVLILVFRSVRPIWNNSCPSASSKRWHFIMRSIIFWPAQNNNLVLIYFFLVTFSYLSVVYIVIPSNSILSSIDYHCHLPQTSSPFLRKTSNEPVQIGYEASGCSKWHNRPNSHYSPDGLSSHMAHRFWSLVMLSD